MLRTAGQKIRDWWHNPYWAPITEPLKYIGKAAYTPISSFVEDIHKAIDDDNYYGNDKSKPVLARVFKEFANVDHFGVWISGTAGAALGGLAAAVGAGAAAAAAGVSWPLITAAAISSCAIGFVATPFLIMGALAFGGAVVGAVAAPAGLVSGGIKAYKHHQFQKTQAAVAQAIPSLQQEAPDVREAAARIFESLRDLPAGIQGPLLKSLSEKFAASGHGAAERIMKAIEALPDAEREALVKGLRTTLAPVFDAVAQQEANASVTLQNDALTMSPLKLKRPKAAAVA